MNIILVKLRCLHLTFSLVIHVRRVGCKLSRLVYLAPRPGLGSGSVISQFLLLHNLGIFSCKRYKHYFSQTGMCTSNIKFGYPCPRGRGQAVQAGLSCPAPHPPRSVFGSGRVTSQFLLHHWSKHLRLTELKFISLSTKYSCSRCCNKFADYPFSLKFWAGGKIKRPGQLAPPLANR